MDMKQALDFIGDQIWFLDQHIDRNLGEYTEYEMGRRDTLVEIFRKLRGEPCDTE